MKYLPNGGTLPVDHNKMGRSGDSSQNSFSTCEHLSTVLESLYQRNQFHQFHHVLIASRRAAVSC